MAPSPNIRKKLEPAKLQKMKDGVKGYFYNDPKAREEPSLYVLPMIPCICALCGKRSTSLESMGKHYKKPKPCNVLLTDPAWKHVADQLNLFEPANKHSSDTFGDDGDKEEEEMDSYHERKPPAKATVLKQQGNKPIKSSRHPTIPFNIGKETYVGDDDDEEEEESDDSDDECKPPAKATVSKQRRNKAIKSSQHPTIAPPGPFISPNNLNPENFVPLFNHFLAHQFNHFLAHIHHSTSVTSGKAMHEPTVNADDSSVANSDRGAVDTSSDDDETPGNRAKKPASVAGKSDLGKKPMEVPESQQNNVYPSSVSGDNQKTSGKLAKKPVSEAGGDQPSKEFAPKGKKHSSAVSPQTKVSCCSDIGDEKTQDKRGKKVVREAGLVQRKKKHAGRKKHGDVVESKKNDVNPSSNDGTPSVKDIVAPTTSVIKSGVVLHNNLVGGKKDQMPSLLKTVNEHAGTKEEITKSKGRDKTQVADSAAENEPVRKRPKRAFGVSLKKYH